MFQTNLVKEVKTHILWSVIFFSEIVAFMRLCGKNMVQPDMPQMTIYNVAHALCMLKN